ncbi:MAG TPA: hypothetical protein VNT22_01510 [Baekduia sp.]|nr:hypothetical protein [Baekduia sp.]
MLIALGATVAIALLWFVALRPKDEAAAPVATPAPQAVQTTTTGTGKSLLSRPEQAQQAVGAANQASSAAEEKANAVGQDQTSAQSQSQTTASTPSSTTKADATPPAQSGTANAADSDLSAPIIAAAKRGTLQLVLFYDKAGADDRFVRRQLQDVDRRGGDVKVRVVPISRVGRYKTLTDTVKVEVAPTLVFISPKLTARTITGYTEAGEINGLIGAILRANR